MRGSALFWVGVAFMACALSFAAVAASWVVRNSESEQGAVPTPAPTVHGAPASSKGKPAKAKLPEPDYGPVLKIPERQRHKVVKHAQPRHKPSQRAQSVLEGDLPAADTTTLVAVKTCEGDTMMLNAAEKQMFELHNRTRVSKGLGPLCLSSYLTRLARYRSEDMMRRGYFSHYAPPDGTTVSDLVKRAGNPENYSWVGENISMGGNMLDEDTPQYEFSALMHSPGHRANILRKEFDEIGIEAVSGNYAGGDDTATIYTMIFGAR